MLKIAVLLVLLTAMPAYADLYQWKDAQGVIHITDTMEKVPPDYRDKVEVFKETPKELPTTPGYTPPPLRPDPGQELFGDQTLEWWQQSLARKRNEINELQSSVNSKTQYMEVFEGGRRFGQIFGSEEAAKYNIYKEELPSDLRRLAEMREEFEDLQRRARLVGVPRHIREP